MKKALLIPVLLALAILFIQPLTVLAQDGKTGKVTITITENDKVITDTTFELREGQDPESVKEIISHVLGEDIDFASKGKEHKEIVWITSEDDKHVGDVKEFDIDSISEDEGHVMVFKDESGDVQKVIVKKHPGEGEDVIILSGKKIKVMEKEGTGYKTIIIEENGDEGMEGKEKRVKVIVESDDDMEIIKEDDIEWVEENDEAVDVYVIKKDDGTKVIKKVKVEVKEIDEDEETPAPVKEQKNKK